jgi:hypothetical protein
MARLGRSRPNKPIIVTNRPLGNPAIGPSKPPIVSLKTVPPHLRLGRSLLVTNHPLGTTPTFKPLISQLKSCPRPSQPILIRPFAPPAVPSVTYPRLFISKPSYRSTATVTGRSLVILPSQPGAPIIISGYTFDPVAFALYNIISYR